MIYFFAYMAACPLAYSALLSMYWAQFGGVLGAKWQDILVNLWFAFFWPISLPVAYSMYSSDAKEKDESWMPFRMVSFVEPKLPAIEKFRQYELEKRK